MKQLSLFFCLFLVWVTISQTVGEGRKLPLTDCGSTVGSVKDLTIYPYKPRRGAFVTFQSTLTTNRRINGGSFHARVTRKILGRDTVVYRDQVGLCRLVKDGRCPTEAHKPATLAYRVYLPPLTPYGEYNCEITYTDFFRRTLICFKAKFVFTRTSEGDTIVV